MRPRRALVVLAPLVWVGFAYGLWQRRRRLWVSYRTRPSTVDDMWAVLCGSTGAVLVALTVWGLWPTSSPRPVSDTPLGVLTSMVVAGQMRITNGGLHTVRCAPVRSPLPHATRVQLAPGASWVVTVTAQEGPWECLEVHTALPPVTTDNAWTLGAGADTGTASELTLTNKMITPRYRLREKD